MAEPTQPCQSQPLKLHWRWVCQGQQCWFPASSRRSVHQHSARQQQQTPSPSTTAWHHMGYGTIKGLASLWLLQAPRCAPQGSRRSTSTAHDSLCALGQQEVKGSSGRPQALVQEPGTTGATCTQECRQFNGCSLCAPGQQEVNGGIVPAGTGLGQRGVALCVLLGQVGPSSRQQVDDLQMTLAGREMQRGPAAVDRSVRDSATLSCKV